MEQQLFGEAKCLCPGRSLRGRGLDCRRTCFRQEGTSGAAAAAHALVRRQGGHGGPRKGMGGARIRCSNQSATRFRTGLTSICASLSPPWYPPLTKFCPLILAIDVLPSKFALSVGAATSGFGRLRVILRRGSHIEAERQLRSSLCSSSAISGEYGPSSGVPGQVNELAKYTG